MLLTVTLDINSYPYSLGTLFCSQSQWIRKLSQKLGAWVHPDTLDYTLNSQCAYKRLTGG